jgi:hypothetical protein
VLLGGIPRVLDGLNVVGMRQLGVVGGFLKPSLHVVLSGCQVLLGGLFEMFSCLLVMFGRLLRMSNPFQGISLFSESATTLDPGGNTEPRPSPLPGASQGSLAAAAARSSSSSSISAEVGHAAANLPGCAAHSDQARELASVLLEAADELDGWTQ